MRAVIWRCRDHEQDDCGGLGDRIKGIISILAYALLTDRAFFIDWPRSHSVFEGADRVVTTLPDQVWDALRRVPPEIHYDFATLKRVR